MRLYVARHGETEWNRDGRYQGRRESALTVLGRLQAQALARGLEASGAQRVMCSPLQRCVDTAQPLARALGVEMEADPRLVEIAHGKWEGRLRDALAHEDPQRVRAWRERPDSVTFEGGEALSDVERRWRSFALALDARTTVVVTHDVLVRLAILGATKRPLSRFWEPRVANGGYAVLDVHAGSVRLLEECHDAHLESHCSDASVQAL